MSQYSTGRAIERKIINFLRDNGYNAVRSAGSKGAFDVVAYNDEIVRFIQSKYTSTKNHSYAADLRKMSAAGTPEFTTKELWVYEKNIGFIEVHFISKPRRVIIPKGASIILHDTGDS